MAAFIDDGKCRKATPELYRAISAKRYTRFIRMADSCEKWIEAEAIALAFELYDAENFSDGHTTLTTQTWQDTAARLRAMYEPEEEEPKACVYCDGEGVVLYDGEGTPQLNCYPCGGTGKARPATRPQYTEADARNDWF